MFKFNPFIMFGEAPSMYRFISFGSTKSKSSPVRVNMYTPEQQEMMTALGIQIKPGVEGNVPAYPGQMFTPQTPEETAYFQSVSGGQSARQEAIDKMLSGKPAYDITPETTEELYQAGVKAPMMQEYKEITEPAIRESFAGPGYWGSARAEAQVTGAEHLATTLGAKRAELAYADEQARRAALESGAGRMAAGEAAAVAEAGVMGTAGQYSRMIDQEKVTADLQRWLMGETVEGVTPTQFNPFLTLAFSFLGLDPYQLGTESKSSGWNVGILA